MKPHVKSILSLIREYIGTPKSGAEIGVWKGQTSEALCQAFPTCMMYLIDTWTEFHRGDVYYDKHAVMGRLTQDEWDEVFKEAVRRVQSTNGSFIVEGLNSEKAAILHKDKSLDFVFLDANHMYEEVKRDILTWAPKVRNGGLVMGHDCGGVHDKRGIWGVTKAVTEVFGNTYHVRPGLVWAVVKE